MILKTTTFFPRVGEIFFRRLADYFSEGWRDISPRVGKREIPALGSNRLGFPPGVRHRTFLCVQCHLTEPPAVVGNCGSFVPDKSKFRLSGLNSLYNITTRKAVVILSGAPAKSKDLRISFIFAIKLVPRSWGFASLAQDDSCSCFLLIVRFNNLAA